MTQQHDRVALVTGGAQGIINHERQRPRALSKSRKYAPVILSEAKNLLVVEHFGMFRCAQHDNT